MNPLFHIASVWAPLTLILFIGIIVLSYRIEARSRPKAPVPVFTNIIATALNIGVARDSRTQALRRLMLVLWAVILVGFAGFAIAVGSLSPPPSSNS